MPGILRWLLRLGPTNPIAVRLVQNASRRTRHLTIRLAYLGVLIAVLLYALLLNVGGGSLSYRALALAGAEAFTLTAYLQIGLICVIAPVFMAGAIAQEANPRTWDILLTTPLSSVEIVLGNLIGRLFFILALLFSSLPLFAVTQYFGGVPGRSIFASYGIAASAALLVGAMAIALSVSRVVGKRAVFAFYVAVVSYLAVTLAIDRLTGGGRVVTWMTAVNPFLTLQALLDPTGYQRPAEGSSGWLGSWLLERPVTTWCVWSTTLSLVLLIGSTLTVRLGGLGAAGGGSTGGVPLYRRVLGLGAKGAEHRPPREVWSNPIAWREAAARNATLGRMLARWSFIAAGGLFGIALPFLYVGGFFGPTVFRQILTYTVLGELAVVALVGLNMAATAVTREREDGTLDLLLTTPITPRQYLAGKLRGIIAYLIPLLAVPLGTLAIAGGYSGLAMLADLGATTGAGTLPYNVPGAGLTIDVPLVLPEAGLVATPVTVAFAAVMVLIGMQWSLKSKGSLSSVVATVAVVGVVGGVIGLCAGNTATDLPFLGPGLAASSPATIVLGCIVPGDTFSETVVQSQDLAPARLGLAGGVIVFTAVYAAVAYGLLASTVRSFDMTVRRLAGNK